MKKRLLSMLLAIGILISLIPGLTAAAAEGDFPETLTLFPNNGNRLPSWIDLTADPSGEADHYHLYLPGNANVINCLLSWNGGLVAEYEGKEYDFNFSKLHLMVKTEFFFEEQDELVHWNVRQESIHAVMETEVFCRKKDMLLVNYEAPDGSKKHNRLWNGGNGWGTVKLFEKKDEKPVLVDEIEATHVGCEYGEYDQ